MSFFALLLESTGHLKKTAMCGWKAGEHVLAHLACSFTSYSFEMLSTQVTLIEILHEKNHFQLLIACHLIWSILKDDIN